jgi:hypothetical protein
MARWQEFDCSKWVKAGVNLAEMANDGPRPRLGFDGAALSCIPLSMRG